ncbi:MAG TPA: hypothetical protein VFC79_05795 [Tissierellaceae bacterium]|nr:hypothetical protein [Tissierellaceae bacterium]
MKVVYRGHEIEVTREKCLGGWSELYTSVFRLSDGLECICSVEDSAEKIVDQVRYMKERIDEELALENPWEDV